MWQRTLYLFLFLSLCYAHAQIVTTRALTPFLEVEAGNTVNLVVVFENVSSGEIKIETELELPTAWRALIPLGEVTVAANSELVVPFTVSVPKGTAAGNYTIVVSTLNEALEAVFTINVATVASLEVDFISFPKRIIADPYTIQAVLNNSGNQALVVDVHVDDNLNFTIAPKRLQLRVESQQSETIDIQVMPPRTLDVQRRQEININVLNAETQEQMAHVKKSLVLIPTVRSQYIDWQLFPIVLSVSKSQWSFQNNSLEGISFNVVGRGRLTDADNGLLDFRVNADALLQRNRFSIRYAKPSFGIVVANTTAFLSQVGIRLNNKGSIQAASYYNFRVRSNWLLTPYFYISWLDSWRTGIRSNYAFAAEHNLNGMFEVNYQNQDLLLVTNLSYTNWFADFRTRLSGDYLVHLIDSTNMAAQFTAKARINNTTHNFDTTYRHTQEAYRGRDNAESSLNFSYSMRSQALKASARFHAYSEWEHSSEQDDSQEHKFEISLNRTINRNNWRLISRYTVFPNMQQNNKLQTTLQLFQRFDRDNNSYLRHRLRYMQYFADPTSDKLDYLAHLVYPVGEFTLEPRLAFELKTKDFSLVNFEPSIDLSLELDNIELEASYAPFAKNYFELDSSIDFDVTNRSRLSFEAGMLFSKTSDTDLYLRAAYSYRFNVPVSKKTKVATVSGVLRDNNGLPLANTLVEVSGQFIQTNSEGEFQLTNILEGDVYFQVVEGQLLEGEITSPASPYFFSVEAQQSYNLEFIVVQSASIQLQAKYEEILTEDDVIVEKVNQDNLFNQLEILLTSEQGEVLKLRTNDKGYVVARELLPGKWGVKTYLISDGRSIDIEVSNSELILLEGEEQMIDIILRPKVRKLKIIDGGSVTFGVDDD